MEGGIAEGFNEIFKPTNQEILIKNFIISPDKDEHSENGHEAQLVCSNWSNNVIKNEQYCQRRMWKTLSESKY